MKILFYLILFNVSLLSGFAAQVATKISDYPNTATLDNANLFLIADPTGALGNGKTNYNISFQQLLALIPSLASTNEVRINGSVVINPNFIDTGTVTWSVVGTNVSAAASGGGGGTVGTMINITATSVGQVLFATATTKTNFAPSGSLLLDASTNVQVIGEILAHAQVISNSLTLLNATAGKPARIGSDQSVTNGLIDLSGSDVTGALPGGSVGSGISAANITSGTLPNARLSAVPNSALANNAVTINGTAISLGGSKTLTLASSDYANQGTTTTLLHGNASGNPSFAAVSLTADVTGIVPKANGGSGADNSSVTFPSSGTVLSDVNTANLQNKSFRTAEIFQTPFRYDGAGAVPTNTNDYTAVNLQRAVFSAAGLTNANWVEWDWIVPFDVDTAVDWKIETLSHEAGGSNTGSVTWTVGMADVASGGTSNPTSFSNWIQMTSGTLSSPSAGKLYYITGTTLTSWKSSVTAGHKIKIRMSRDGTDANSDAQTLGDWVLSYGRKTQL